MQMRDDLTAGATIGRDNPDRGSVRGRRGFPWILASSMLFGTLACAATPEISSVPASTPIVVDGDPAEWDGRTAFLEEERIALGVQHTSGSIYVSWVLTDSPRQRLVLGRGVTLWIDPTGGTKEALGIRFPLGFREGRVDPQVADGSADPADIDSLLEDMLGSLDLIAAGDTMRAESGDRGVEVAVRNVGGSLVYEARLSLEEGSFLRDYVPEGIGSTVGIGIVSPRPEGRGGRASVRGGMGAGRGGRRAPGGGTGGGPGGRSGPPPDMAEGRPTLDFWVSAVL